MATKYKPIEQATEAELADLSFFVDSDGMVWTCDAGEDVATEAVKNLMQRVAAEHRRRTH
jgi:hypothetical protein